MSDINSVVISGRIGQDMELRNTGENAVVNIRLAHDAGKDKTVWIDATVWGVTAENTVKFLKKGDKITVAGKLQQRQYTNKDGVNVTVTEIRAFDVQWPEAPKASGGDGGGGGVSITSLPSRAVPQPAPTFEPSDELPF